MKNGWDTGGLWVSAKNKGDEKETLRRQKAKVRKPRLRSEPQPSIMREFS